MVLGARDRIARDSGRPIGFTLATNWENPTSLIKLISLTFAAVLLDADESSFKITSVGKD